VQLPLQVIYTLAPASPALVAVANEASAAMGRQGRRHCNTRRRRTRRDGPTVAPSAASRYEVIAMLTYPPSSAARSPLRQRLNVLDSP